MLWIITRSAPTIASTDIDLTTLQKQLGMFVTIPVAHPDRKSDGSFQTHRDWSWSKIRRRVWSVGRLLQIARKVLK